MLLHSVRCPPAEIAARSWCRLNKHKSKLDFSSGVLAYLVTNWLTEDDRSYCEKLFSTGVTLPKNTVLWCLAYRATEICQSVTDLVNSAEITK